MPRVLRIINRFNLGGPTYNAAYLTHYLSPDFETMLIGGLHDPSEASSQYILDKLGIDYTIIPEMKRSLNPSLDSKAYKQISSLIQSFKPDIVHTHAAKAGALGRMAAIRNKVPVIVHTFHGHVLESYFSPLKNRVFTEIEKYLAGKSSKIIALSQKQKDELTRILSITDEDKIRIIPLGFDLSRFQENQQEKRKQFREKYFLADDEIAIGIIGRLVAVKNHALFLTAIDHLQKRTTKKVRAFIIGDGEERIKLEKLATESGIFFSSPNVERKNAFLTFTSWIKEMDVVMAGLDIVTLTSLNEGTPVSLIEAQAANKPVVTTRVGGIENVVIPGKTALLSDIGDIHGFCENLLHMTEEDNLRTEFSAHGWNHVKDNYHYSRLTKDIKNLYLELLNSKK